MACKRQNCRYHVSHISSKETVEIIRKAKKEGLKVTCDTAPPYFMLNELSLENYRTFSKLISTENSEDEEKQLLKALRWNY